MILKTLSAVPTHMMKFVVSFIEKLPLSKKISRHAK